jgi:DMSO/TMAO reductase YedYZ molybdopterin-dependent catalytic subunit
VNDRLAKTAAPRRVWQVSSRKSRAPLKLAGKSQKLVVLGERPLVAQTPESLLDDDTTPTALMFIRNNGRMPARTSDPENWTFKVDGEVENALSLTLRDLKAKFETVTRRLLIECGGNGRSFFDPPVRGNRWTHGGVGCPEWTGVRLADVLRQARLKPTAVFSGHYGADPTTSGDTSKPALSRGVPVAKLMDDSNLLAWAINGEPLPLAHGFPLRLVIPGWPGSVSAKWLTRIWIRDRHHDGPGMGGILYRVPITPMPAGQYDRKNLTDLESMPVRAIITRPADRTIFDRGTPTIELRGAAWAGDHQVRQVDISIDRGVTWQQASLQAPKNRHDWRRWTAQIDVPAGVRSLDIWARGTDELGRTQPLAVENWNPHGVGGNPVHRVAVKLGD